MPNDTAAWPEHPFWEWSLRVYARPGVAPALLQLQDGQGLDVNLVLFCIWSAGGAAGRPSEAELATARTALARWRGELVGPLRALRRACSPEVHALPAVQLLLVRQALQQAELAAEHAAQLCLAMSLHRDCPAAPDRAALEGAAAGLRHLLVLESVAADADVLDRLGSVLAGCLPGIDLATARRALESV